MFFTISTVTGWPPCRASSPVRRGTVWHSVPAYRDSSVRDGDTADAHGDTNIGRNMAPPAMDLSSPHVQHWSDAELFWIIQNGVRLTGMPSWKSSISDNDTWKLARFIHNLPRLDADFPFDNGFRVVQYTPPGSGCSVQFGTKITLAAPGSAQSFYLVVSDIEAARDDLAARGVKISEVFHAGSPGAQFQPDGMTGRVSGPAPDHAIYSSFATFSDPDGNGWLLQEITTRLPGRIDRVETSFASANDLAGSLRCAAAAHGEHEKRIGQPDANWPDWYAEYMVRERSGEELPR
ncbi:MAG: c-type cytochrome [Edaphobacter sp.]